MSDGGSTTAPDPQAGVHGSDLWHVTPIDVLVMRRSSRRALSGLIEAAPRAAAPPDVENMLDVGPDL